MGNQELGLRRHQVGADQPILIVAECGTNHNGDLRLALRMIEAAAGAGADGIEFLLFRAAGMCTPQAGLWSTATGGHVSVCKLREDLELPRDWIPQLSRTCHAHGVVIVADGYCSSGIGTG
jgi:N,N'-diacetyllegionaminate synthase